MIQAKHLIRIVEIVIEKTGEDNYHVVAKEDFVGEEHVTGSELLGMLHHKNLMRSTTAEAVAKELDTHSVGHRITLKYTTYP